LSKTNHTDTRAQDYVANKLLSVFTIAFLLILGLVYVSRLMSRAPSFVSTFKAMPWIAAGFGVLTVVCAVIAIIQATKGVKHEYRLCTAKHFAFVFGFTALCALLLARAFTKNTLTFLYVLIPTVAVLYIIFYTYPRDFFTVAAASGIGAITVWALESLNSIGMYPILLFALLILSVLVVVLLIVGTAIAQKKDGKLFGKQIFDSLTLYPLLYLTYALVAAALIATFLLGSAVLYIAAFGLVGYLVAIGIYYTVRQI